METIKHSLQPVWGQEFRADHTPTHMPAPTLPHLNVNDYHGGKYCELCTCWLNGPEVFDEHLAGKKHQKNLRRLMRQQTPHVQKVHRKRSGMPSRHSAPYRTSRVMAGCRPYLHPFFVLTGVVTCEDLMLLWRNDCRVVYHMYVDTTK